MTFTTFMTVNDQSMAVGQLKPVILSNLWQSVEWHKAELITSAKEDMSSSLFVLCVSSFAQKLLSGFAWNFQGRLAMGQWANH